VTDIQDRIASLDAPHDYSLELKPGDVMRADAPDPEIEVVDANVMHPKAIAWQQLTVRATDQLSGRVERFVVGRVVAVFDGDDGETEIEIGERTVIPAALLDHPTADLTTCAACGAPIIDQREAVVYRDAAYHAGCFEVDEPKPPDDDTDEE